LERNIEGLMPKIYFADEYTIAMDDIIKKGFKMVKKPAKQGIEHAQ